MAPRADTSRALRRRRTAEEARREILAAAERRLRTEGPAGLRVQAIARDVGVTDAAVHHHFGSRRGLAEALLRHAGRQLREEVRSVAATTPSSDRAGLEEIAGRIARVYDDLGYAKLALWLGLLEHQPRGAGLFDELVDLLAARGASRGDARFAVAALNVVLWAEPFVGPAMLRSVGLAGDRKTVRRFRRWIVRQLDAGAGLGTRSGGSEGGRRGRR